MAGKLLILSFHNDKLSPAGEETKLDEDLLFKRSALASPFLLSDAMDEPGARAALHPSLFDDPQAGIYSGLEEGTFGSSPQTRLIGLNRVGGNAWWRPPYLRQKDPAHPQEPPSSLFERWLRQVFTTPIDVLVLSGHHEGGLLWGAQDAAVKHRWYTALRPILVTDETGTKRSMLEVWGHKLQIEGKDLPRMRAGRFDMTATLASCRLVIIMGCNGATLHGRIWRDWVRNAAGRAPFLLGWYNLHSFPVNRLPKEHFSAHFWDGMKNLSPAGDLSILHNSDFTRRIIDDAWVGAMKKGFGTSATQRHLLFGGKKDRGPRGAGAITPAGEVWWVVDEQGNVEKKGKIS